MSKATVDIAVAGAGIVGLTAATLFADLGYSVALVGPRENVMPPSGDYDLRTYALSPASMRVLARAGARLNVSRIADIAAMRVWDAGSSGSIEFSAERAGYPALAHLVEHAALMAALGNVADAARTETRAARVAGLRQYDDRVELILDDDTVISAGLVLACDGAHSSVRELLGIAAVPHAFAQHAVVCNVRIAGTHANTARQRFLRDGPLALLPLPPADQCAVVWSTASAGAMAARDAEDGAFMRLLEDAFGEEAVTATSPRVALPLNALHARNYVRGRCVLLGDAAHVVHPLAGQGLNLGLMDVATIAQVFAAPVERDLAFPRAALRRYERTRRGETLAMLQATRWMNHLFRNDRRATRAVRGAGMRAVDRIGPLKNWFMLRAMGEIGDVPRIARRAFE